MRSVVGILLAWTVLAASPAMAQERDAIETPDALSEAAQQGVTIEWPAPGDSVQVPFTVTGRAAPGARLQLRLGGVLERAFLADANGRFTAPVTRAMPGAAIEIAEVDREGNTRQAAEVDVRWGGAPIEPVETVAGAPIDPFGTEPASPPGTLPRVSELGTGTPPPPDELFAEAPAPVVETSAEPDVAYVPPQRPPAPLGVRVAAESAVGLGGALAGGFGGVIVGAALGAAEGGWAPLVYGAMGGIVGWAVGLPIGVILGGKMVRATGKWYGAVLGEVVGILAGGLLAAATSGNSDGSAQVVILGVVPLAGAVIGYELTADPEPARGMRSLRPVLAPSADGTVTVGFGLRY